MTWKSIPFFLWTVFPTSKYTVIFLYKSLLISLYLRLYFSPSLYSKNPQNICPHWMFPCLYFYSLLNPSPSNSWTSLLHQNCCCQAHQWPPYATFLSQLLILILLHLLGSSSWKQFLHLAPKTPNCPSFPPPSLAAFPHSWSWTSFSICTRCLMICQTTETGPNHEAVSADRKWDSGPRMRKSC